MITIIEDISGLITEEKHIYLQEYSEYVKIYISIQKAIQENTNLTIVVRISVVLTWFEKLASRYETNVFKFEKITYRTRLQAIWGIDIPEEYSSEDLAKSDLLNLDTYPKHTDTFEDFILSYFFDPVFSNHSFTSGLIVSLVKSYDKQKWDKNIETNLLRNIYNRRVSEWQNKIKEDYLLSVLNDCLDNPEKVVTQLMSYKLLRTKIYHEIGKLTLSERFQHLGKLKNTN